MEEVDHPPDHLLAAVVALHGPELRRGNGEDSRHCRQSYPPVSVAQR
jgi:hypothetical protein